MKKYCLHPGVGRITPGEKEHYISAVLLAARCYRVPMSECLNMDDSAIRKMASIGAKFDQLIHLTPNSLGIYKIPRVGENRIIIAQGIPEQVRK